MSKNSSITPYRRAGAIAALVLATMITAYLAVLKLAGLIKWSWLGVLSPLWGAVAALILVGVGLVVIATVNRRHPIRMIEADEAASVGVEKLNLVGHARRELALLGETDQAFVDSIIAAVQGFSSYPGHSGGSAPIAVEYVHDLLRWRTLTPLTRDAAEWIDRTEISGRPMWQNNRDPRAISEDGGLTYWLVDESPPDSDSTDAPRYTSAEPFTVPQ